MKNVKRLCAVFLIVIMTFAIAACGTKKEYSFGTGNIGGNYYSYGNALAGLTQADDITLNVKSTAGSAANLRLLQKGFLDVAIVQSDILLDAYNGKGMFSGNACTNVRAIAGLYIEECQIIVKADSGIDSVDDLYGKVVSVGENESGVMQNAEQILKANGLTFNNVNAKYLSFSDSAAALESGEIDAFFCTAGAPTVSVQELAKSTNIKLISLDEKTCKKLVDEYACYVEMTIPAGTYQGQEEDVKTLGVKAVLVTNSKVSKDFVEYLTGELFSNASELQYATSAEALDTGFATSYIPVPFHNGAANWYSGEGITVSTSNASSDFGINAGQD